MALNINGTTGISGVDGSASAPALQGSDSNTGLSFGTDTVNINTGGSTRATVDSSGRVLIGTTTEGTVSGDDLTISNSGNMGLTLRSTDSNYCNIYFSDATSGAAEYAGYVSYQHSTDSLQIATSSTERMRIDSSGKVLLGKTSTSQTHTLQVQSDSSANAICIFGRSADDIGELSFLENDGTTRMGEIQYRTTEASFRHRSAGASLLFSTTPSGGSVTERMRINSSGTLFLGKTSQSSSTPGVELYKDGPNFMTRNASGGSVLGLNDQNSTTGDALKIYYSDVLRGSLVYNGASFFAYTASDYRLKENDTPISDGITRVKQLRPIKYNWKTDATKTYDGFIAHEVQSVVPDCVVGEKDAEVDSHGEGYQRLAVAGLVPVLTAALKEAIGKIETLESEKAKMQTDLTALTARVTALEVA